MSEKDQGPMLSVRCPCGKRYRVTIELAGQKVKCASCGRAFALPALTTPKLKSPTRPTQTIPDRPSAASEEDSEGYAIEFDETAEENALQLEETAQSPPAVTCSVCGKPVTPTALSAYGTFCSLECVQQDPKRRKSILERAHEQKAEAAEEEVRPGKKLAISIAAGAALILAIACVLWLARRSFVKTKIELAWELEGPGGQKLSAPLIFKRSAIVTCGDGKVYALDLKSGEKLWATEVGRYAPANAPVMIGQDTCAVASGERICSLDLNDGKLLWEHKIEKPIARPILASGGAIAVVLGDARREFQTPYTYPQHTVQQHRPFTIHLLDSSTGKELWRYGAPGTIVRAIGEGHGRVLFVDQRANTAPAQLLCLDRSSGKLRWRKQMPRSDSWDIIKTGSGLVVRSDSLVCSFDAAGMEQWRAQAAAKRRFSSVESFGKNVYYGAGDGCLYCVSARSGEKVWMRNIRANPVTILPTEKLVFASGAGREKEVKSPTPSVGTEATYAREVLDGKEGSVFIPSVRAFDAGSGLSKWTYNDGGERFFSSPKGDILFVVHIADLRGGLFSGVVVKGTVNESTIRAIRIADGQKLWELTERGILVGDLQAQNGRAYLTLTRSGKRGLEQYSKRNRMGMEVDRLVAIRF